MEIYFAGSIRAGREDVGIYAEIIGHLKKYGEVLTEHIGDKKVTVRGEEDGPNDKFIHDRDMNWIAKSDVFIADVSIPSTGVGYEIRDAVELGKDILCLYRPQNGKKLSAMISGCPDLVVREYQTVEEAKKIIDEFFSSIKSS